METNNNQTTPPPLLKQSPPSPRLTVKLKKALRRLGTAFMHPAVKLSLFLCLQYAIIHITAEESYRLGRIDGVYYTVLTFVDIVETIANKCDPL